LLCVDSVLVLRLPFISARCVFIRVRLRHYLLNVSTFRVCVLCRLRLCYLRMSCPRNLCVVALVHLLLCLCCHGVRCVHPWFVLGLPLL